MKTEIKLEELLEQITSLPWRSEEHMDAEDRPAIFINADPHYAVADVCGRGKHLSGSRLTGAYLVHCANVLPELVKAARVIVDKIPRDGYALDDWEKLDVALSRAEKVTLP